MHEFADHNWSRLRDDDYKPYARLYAVRPSKDDRFKSPHAEIAVGFYRWKKRKLVHERYICLALDCDDMRLFVWCGWTLGKGHTEYKHDDEEWGRVLKKRTRPQSFLLFKEPFDDARKEIQAQLERCLRKFKKSRYDNA
jgi:nicotinamide riboside kinase